MSRRSGRQARKGDRAPGTVARCGEFYLLRPRNPPILGSGSKPRALTFWTLAVEISDIPAATAALLAMLARATMVVPRRAGDAGNAGSFYLQNATNLRRPRSVVMICSTFMHNAPDQPADR